MNYQEWLERVDYWLLDRTMMTHDLIDNYDFEDAYESGKSPQRTAIESVFDVDLDNEI